MNFSPISDSTSSFLFLPNFNRYPRSSQMELSPENIANKEAASDGEEKYGKNKVVCADGGFHGCFLSGYLEESPAIKAILMAMIMKGRRSRNRTRIIAKIPAKAISMQSEPHSRRRHPVR